MKQTVMSVTLCLVVTSGVAWDSRADQRSIGSPVWPCLPAEQTARFGNAADEARFSNLVETVHQEVNDFRRGQDLKPLVLNPIISTRAREHSNEMAAKGKLTHEGFQERLEEMRNKLPVRAAAENVGMIAGYEDPARAVVEGWKKSPEHRKNMLGEFSRTGIGVARTEQGHYFFTQVFVQ